MDKTQIIKGLGKKSDVKLVDCVEFVTSDALGY